MNNNSTVNVKNEKKVKAVDTSVEMKKQIDWDSDTALLDLVNRHSEKMRKERMIEEQAMAAKEEQRRIARMERAKKEKRKAKVNTVLNVIQNVLFILSIVFLAWVFFSWANVVAHNTEPGGYELIWNWNFFKVFFGH